MSARVGYTVATLVFAFTSGYIAGSGFDAVMMLPLAWAIMAGALAVTAE